MKIKLYANFEYVLISLFFAVLFKITLQADYFEVFMLFGMTALLLNIKRENGEK